MKTPDTVCSYVPPTWKRMAVDTSSSSAGIVIVTVRALAVVTIFSSFASTGASALGTKFFKAGVPAGWRVAHKTGTGGYGPTNDIGVVYPPAGEPITLAVYYHGVRNSSDAENETVIADATRMTLAALGHAA